MCLWTNQELTPESWESSKAACITMATNTTSRCVPSTEVSKSAPSHLEHAGCGPCIAGGSLCSKWSRGVSLGSSAPGSCVFLIDFCLIRTSFERLWRGFESSIFINFSVHGCTWLQSPQCRWIFIDQEFWGPLVSSHLRAWCIWPTALGSQDIKMDAETTSQISNVSHLLCLPFFCDVLGWSWNRWCGQGFKHVKPWTGKITRVPQL